jgi:hypothetical protein
MESKGQTMGGFSRIGEAILLAEQGKREIAHALFEMLEQRFNGLKAFFTRGNTKGRNA